MDPRSQVSIPPTSDSTLVAASRAEQGANYAADARGAAKSPIMPLGEIYYCLFRHKWKILILALTGLLAAFAVRKSWPVMYVSQAKLLIRYLQESTSPTDVGDSSNITSTDVRGETIINSELQILTSRNLAEKVAATVGAEKILPSTVEEPSVSAAAGLVVGGLTAGAPQGSRVVSVSFRHTDAAVVQPVLDELIRHYLETHLEIHQTVGLYDFLAEETDQLRSRLTQTEKELQGLMDRAGVLSLDEIKKAYAEQMASFRQEIFTAEAQLAERTANLAELTVKDAEMEVRLSVASEYRRIKGLLEKLYEREQELLLDFTPENVVVSRVRSQIADNEEFQRSLEREHPWLVYQTIMARSPSGTPSGFTLDPIAESTQIRNLETRIRILQEQLENIRTEAARLGTLELAVTDLQRRKDLQESHYRYFFERLEQSRINEALGAGRVSNISIVQTPSPPRQDLGKRDKIVALLGVGGLFAGIALAFFIERYLDQSVKRPVDVENRLGLPLVLSIPLSSPGRLARITSRTHRHSQDPTADQNGENRTASPESLEEVWAEVAPWALNSNMRPYFSALRDRLIYYFQVRDLAHKPKLVAVTSCGDRSGVSTISTGLAAAMSEIGDRSVLLVDLNPEQHQPYHFRNGELTCGLAQALEHETRADARVTDSLYMASRASTDDKCPPMPNLLADLMPKCKSSDYDYIVFDMPPVDRISMTPHFARYMDLLLMVVESGKDNRDVVRRAASLLTEFGGNTGVVLNKVRNYVPRALNQEF